MNLLPFKEQKEIVREYHTRLVVVSVGAATVLVLIALVLFAPAYLIANQKETLAQDQLAQATAGGAGSGVGAEDPKEVVRRIDAKVLVLKPADDAKTPSEIIEALLSHQTGGITIGALFLDTAISGGRMTITGNALRRESLATFEAALKADPLFASVEIPRASYLKPTDIDFSITIVLSGKAEKAPEVKKEEATN